MSYCLAVLYNDNLSRRSQNQYGEGCLFSLDVGKSYLECLADANQGSLYDYNDDYRKGIRTPPRGNDPNWQIVSVFTFDFRYQAENAASIIHTYSKNPKILQVLKKELGVLEGMRSNYMSRRVGWNKVQRIRTMFAEVPTLAIGLYVSAMLDKFKIGYESSHLILSQR